MGSVYRAFDRVLKRVVAVKRVRTDRIAGGDLPRVLARFEREAQAMARVRHPACVAVYDAGLVDGEPYLVMDFVPGRSLAAVIEEGQVDPRTVAEWGRALAEALQACHDVGVVHRDVKPANILVDPEGKVHLTDFGVALDAKAQTKLTLDRGAVGTLCYMPPEQILGAGTDARSDVYALGATLYEALAGRPPFDAELAVMLLRQVVEDEPHRLRSLRANVDEELETIIHTCLAKPQDERYTTAQALALDLSRFLADEPILARPTSVGRRVARRLWRSRHLLAAVTTFVLLVSVGLLGWRARENATVRAAAEEALERARGAADLDAAESRLLPVATSVDPELRARAREALLRIRGRRRLREAEAALDRATQADARTRELIDRALALEGRIDPSVPFRVSAEKKELLRLEGELDDVDRAMAEALAECRRLVAQSAVDVGTKDVMSVEAQLAHLEARVVERSDPARAEALFERAARLGAATAPPAVVSVNADVEATLEVSRYTFDPEAGRMVETVIQRGPIDARVELPGGDYAITVRAPGRLTWRQPMRLLRGETRELRASLIVQAQLGPMHPEVTDVPAGLARWGLRYEARTQVDAFLIQTRELRLEQWMSFVISAEPGEEFLPAGVVDLDKTLQHPARRRKRAFGMRASEAAAYLRWLTGELALGGVSYGARFPTAHELFRATRGEFAWPYPWGTRGDASFFEGLQTSKGRMRTIELFPEEDCSPFGVRELAGSVAELTEDRLGFGMYGGDMYSELDSIPGLLNRSAAIEPHHEGPSVGLRVVLVPIELRPQSRRSAVVQGHVREGMALEAQRDLHGAYSAYTSALAEDRTQAVVWNLRGNVRMLRDDLWGAVWDYTVALGLEPDNAVVLSNRGSTQLRRGAFAEAVSDLTHALELLPDRAPLWLYRGLARGKLEDFAGAVSDLERGLELAPDHPEAPNARAVLAELRSKLR
jgi:tRNA A-37 threonylcarbamoyl transferase component Bud32